MINSFLTYCSGTVKGLVALCPEQERIRQASIGGIVLGTAVLAFCSGGYALFAIFKSVWAAIIFGLIWALIIFNLDKYFILTFCKDGNFWQKLNAGLPRIILAIIIGLTISEPLKLKLFEGEITERLNDKFQEKKARIHSMYDKKIALLKKDAEDRRLAKLELQREAEAEWLALRDTNNARAAQLKGEVAGRNLLVQGSCEILENEWRETSKTNKAKIKRLKSEIAQKDAYKQKLHEFHLRECAGLAGTMIEGDGPECKRTYEAFKTAENEWESLRNFNNRKIAQLEREIAEKKKDRNNCHQEALRKTENERAEIIETNYERIAVLEDEIARKDGLKQQRQQKIEDEWQVFRSNIEAEISKLERLRNTQIIQVTELSSQGFLARHTALKELVKQNDLGVMMLIISLLFMVIETSPIISKWMQPKGSYDRLLQTVSDEFDQKQRVTQEVNKEILANEYHAYLKAKRMSETAYEEVMLSLEKCNVFLDDIICQSEESDKKIQEWISLADRMQNPGLKEKSEAGIETMTEVFSEAQDISFDKFRELLRNEKKISRIDRQGFDVYN
ncbi:DUF4407 domain-containing protein [Desulfonema magnum]|uniref:DUF4407 n=1 Tax=Desulfonema magnum TaxID=45655 RepID=A0A975BST8_9BACT|nr:DUF4407 domain-containing protein [Desulfonema magnum]QTA90415.1 DUF4407 [Desulfonema magnum]